MLWIINISSLKIKCKNIYMFYVNKMKGFDLSENVPIVLKKEIRQAGLQKRPACLISSLSSRHHRGQAKSVLE